MPAIPTPPDAHKSAEKPVLQSNKATSTPPQTIPTPLIRLKITDVSSPGTKLFLQSVDPTTVVQEAVATVLQLLNPAPQFDSYPAIRSITLVLKSFDGVAYTCAKTLDVLHKEIHFSTDYIESIDAARVADEITGVLVHEMVHVWQWNGRNTCNSGLIEGVADWVRLRAGYAPPHWAREAEDRPWDAGYEITAWFLDWLAETRGPGTVPRLNQHLKDQPYVQAKFWEVLFGPGDDVDFLWEQYRSWLETQSDDVGEEEEIQSKALVMDGERATSDTLDEAKNPDQTQKLQPEPKLEPKPEPKEQPQPEQVAKG